MLMWLRQKLFLFLVRCIVVRSTGALITFEPDDIYECIGYLGVHFIIHYIPHSKMKSKEITHPICEAKLGIKPNSWSRFKFYVLHEAGHAVTLSRLPYHKAARLQAEACIARQLISIKTVIGAIDEVEAQMEYWGLPTEVMANKWALDMLKKIPI